MKILRILETSDHLFKLEIGQRDDGHFQYASSEYSEYNGKFYWSPAGTSGIYASFEDAERAALIEFLDSEKPN